MSRAERNRTRLRVANAMRAHTRAGRWLGGRPPYGYRIADAGPHPNPSKAVSGARLHQLEPDPETAPVVRRIFEMYLAGAGYKQIATALTAEGVPSPSAHDPARNSHRPGHAWAMSAVRAILANPRYLGYHVSGRTKKVDVGGPGPPGAGSCDPPALAGALRTGHCLRAKLRGARRPSDLAPRPGRPGSEHPHQRQHAYPPQDPRRGPPRRSIAVPTGGAWSSATAAARSSRAARSGATPSTAATGPTTTPCRPTTTRRAFRCERTACCPTLMLGCLGSSRRGTSPRLPDKSSTRMPRPTARTRQ